MKASERAAQEINAKFAEGFTYIKLEVLREIIERHFAAAQAENERLTERLRVEVAARKLADTNAEKTFADNKRLVASIAKLKAEAALRSVDKGKEPTL